MGSAGRPEGGAVIRRQTLEEWFLAHQLRAIGRRHFHLPLRVSVDVTDLARAWREREGRVPWTALVVKALALVARRHPEINRMLFRTLLGPRVVEFDEVRINLPVLMEHEGAPYLSATVIAGADALPVEAIRDRLREAKARRLSDLPLARRLVGRPNTLWNRLRLRLIHFLVWNLPGLYVRRGGGGLSFSSLVFDDEDAATLSCPSYGPTAWTVCLLQAGRDERGRESLHLEIGFDHLVLRGDECVRGARALVDVLARPDLELLGPAPGAGAPREPRPASPAPPKTERAR